MNTITIIITIAGLALFETISSVDNAVINADVLSSMGKRGKKWFLFWGLIFAVFVVRGLLPWIIFWAAAPSLGIWGSFIAAFSSNPGMERAIGQSAPILLAGGGMFLLFLFFHWLFLETKNFGLRHERFFARRRSSFYAVVFILFVLLMSYALVHNPPMAFGAVCGSIAFFITQGFKQNAERAEEKLKGSKRSDTSKILYLEVIDAAFSIDGVLGAFAFTMSVPLIIIGNGLGALVVRQLTVGNVERIRKYRYLKNGAMYSILFLGIIMLADAFGAAMPGWLSPLITFLTVGYFFERSRRELQINNAVTVPVLRSKLRRVQDSNL